MIALSKSKLFYVLLCAAALLAVMSRPAHAQGYQTNSSYLYWDNEYELGEYTPSEGFEQLIILEIDEDLNIAAYTETYAVDDDDFDESGLEMESDLYIYENEDNIYYSLDIEDSGDAYVEYYGTADPGATYTAEGVAYLDVNALLGNDYGETQAYLGDIYAEVDTDAAAGVPNVDNVNPSSGTIGDSSVSITFYGANLLNSDGTLPSFWTSPSGLHVNATSSTPDGTQVSGNYTIDSGTNPASGIIDLITDGGWSNDVDFPVDAPDASISSISPSTWQAGDTFDVTITGSNFGNNPSVYLTSPGDITWGSVSNSGGTTITISDVSVPSDETSTSAILNVQPGDIGCGSCFTSNDPSDPTGQTQGTATITPAATSCPSSITINPSETVTMPLSGKVPGWLTGIGIMVKMNVGPSTTNFNGTQITENVTQTSNSCPAVPFGNQCAGSATFTVGDDGGGAGGKLTGADGITQVSAASNAFWDQHDTYDSRNDLSVAGITSCSTVCSQTYSCNGTTIPGVNFTITRTYTQGTIGSNSVTNVVVTKN